VLETTIDCPPDDADCEPTEPVETKPCEPETKQFCAPQWLAPCTQDSDCGDGFNCKEQEMCMCKGSSGGSIPPNSTDAPSEPGSSQGSAGSEGEGGTGTGTTGDDAPVEEEDDCEC
jgi:hypothetical protein